ncbi:unnamed protein product [Rotaria sp. Silwood1]|nr:unnamed protein product [Rotaria sp. Silwood1]CAF3438570.1 unnamed protein product [Rotaria sp. Silwood1]CAF4687380.1 unnamed protein product [Rotaria sp. Silwood1]
MIEADPTFIDEIDQVLYGSQSKNKYDQLYCILNKYIHGYAAKVVLGSYQVRVQHKQMGEIYDTDGLDQQIRTNIKANYNEVGASVGLERNKKKARARRKINNNTLIDRSTTGGDALTNDLNEWLEALKNTNT